MMLAKTFALALSVTAVGFCGVGCQTTPTSEAQKESLDDGAQTALKKMMRTSPGLEQTLQNAQGYAIFPNASSAGAIVGGKFGRGEVYEKGQFIGYAKVEEGTIGAQLGGKTFHELVIFENAGAMNKFKAGQWTPSGNASAVILKEGAAVSTAFKDGVMILIDTEGGAMAEASVGAQKFTFQPSVK